MDPSIKMENNMKRTLTLAAALIAATAGTAMAGEIRVNDGRDIIRQGDPASKLARYLGRPYYSEVARVCAKPSNSSCSKSRSKWGHLYQYRYNDLDYTVEIHDGTITRITWSR